MTMVPRTGKAITLAFEFVVCRKKINLNYFGCVISAKIC